METQSSQIDLFRQKNKVLLDENRQLQQQVESLERLVSYFTAFSTLCLSVISLVSVKLFIVVITVLSFVGLQKAGGGWQSEQ